MNIIELDTSKAGKYLAEAINGFLKDPPDSEYQRGFLAALIVVSTEGIGRQSDARIIAAEKMLERGME